MMSCESSRRHGLLGWFSASVVVALVLFGFVGCTGQMAGLDSDTQPSVATIGGLQSEAGNNPQVVSTSSDDNYRYQGPVPEFSGPWAAEFRDAYILVKSDVARKALDDEEISVAEVNEIIAVYNACLADFGFTEIQTNLDGSGSAIYPVGMTDEQINKLDSGCADSSGFALVGGLFADIKGNPENIDVYTIMAECLVRVGARPEGYIAADYRREFMADNPPADFTAGNPGSEKFLACNSDPAHAK